jgi:hypothetical protein
MLPQSQPLEAAVADKGRVTTKRTGADSRPATFPRGDGQKCPRYKARKGGLKGVELGSFRVGSQEKTADAVFGKAHTAGCLRVPARVSHPQQERLRISDGGSRTGRGAGWQESRNLPLQ